MKKTALIAKKRETVSRLAIQHFTARGGELVRLVSLVYLACFVRGMNPTRYSEQLYKQE